MCNSCQRECCSECITKSLKRRINGRLEKQIVCNNCFDYETKHQKTLKQVSTDAQNLEDQIREFIDNYGFDDKKKRMLGELGIQLLLKIDKIGYIPNREDKKVVIDSLNKILDELDRYTIDPLKSLKENTKRMEIGIRTPCLVPLLNCNKIFLSYEVSSSSHSYILNNFLSIRVYL